MAEKYLSNEQNWATSALQNWPWKFTLTFHKTTGCFFAVKTPTQLASSVWIVKTATRQNRVSVRGKEVGTLTVAEHLIISELPVFGKKNPKLEIHRALTIRQQKVVTFILSSKHTQLMRHAGRYLGKLPSDQKCHWGITSSPSSQFWSILTSVVFRYVPDMCITLIFCPLQITQGVHAFWSNEHDSDMDNKYIDKNVTVPFARSLPYSTHCPARSLRCILSAPFSAFTWPRPGISWHVIASEKPSLFVLCSRSSPYTTLLYFLHSSQDYG